MWHLEARRLLEEVRQIEAHDRLISREWARQRAQEWERKEAVRRAVRHAKRMVVLRGLEKKCGPGWAHVVEHLGGPDWVIEFQLD